MLTFIGAVKASVAPSETVAEPIPMAFVEPEALRVPPSMAMLPV